MLWLGLTLFGIEFQKGDCERAAHHACASRITNCSKLRSNKQDVVGPVLPAQDRPEAQAFEGV